MPLFSVIALSALREARAHERENNDGPQQFDFHKASPLSAYLTQAGGQPASSSVTEKRTENFLKTGSQSSPV